jgi:hypothetical protein
MAGILHSIIAPSGAGFSVILIAVDTANVNIRNILLSQGWNGISVVHPTVVIESTAKVFSASTATPAFDTGTLPAGSSVTLTNRGAILGRGGNGGIGTGTPSGSTGGAGGNGGLALKASIAMTITNNGTIGGGGGGGGGGYGIITGSPGGGAGIGGGVGGVANPGTLNSSTAYKGEDSTLIVQGRGYDIGGGYFSGNGGFYGAAGVSAATLGGGGIGGAGGAAGAAVNGNAFITWLVTGTRYGAIS